MLTLGSFLLSALAVLDPVVRCPILPPDCKESIFLTGLEIPLWVPGT